MVRVTIQSMFIDIIDNPPKIDLHIYVLHMCVDHKMTTLEDVQESVWVKLASDYAKMNAVLIVRALYTDGQMCVIDDWEYKAGHIILFKVKQCNGLKLVGEYISQDRKDIITMKPNRNELMWNQQTFSWQVSMPELSALRDAFYCRGLQFCEKSQAFLDVPFGHVVGIDTDVEYFISGRYSCFVSTPFAQLGIIGTKYSKKYRIPIRGEQKPDTLKKSEDCFS